LTDNFRENIVGVAMAKVVLGLGTSHTPMLSTPWEQWRLHVARDKGNPHLVAADGNIYSYEELARRADPRIARDELAPATWRARYEACQAAIERLGAVLADVRPDVLVIIGDDQGEMFAEDQMPALSVYWGETAISIPPDPAGMDESLRVAAWGWYADRPVAYRCEAALGKHVIESLVADGFDVANCASQPPGATLGHAYGFVERRIIKDGSIPIVPVFLNGYYPPNRPTAARSYEIGRAIRRAIDGWDANRCVGIVASGGLSHLVVSEELDRKVIAALQDKDVKTLITLPEPVLRWASGEIKNWIAAAGALEDLAMRLIDYVPGYRSPAGTGVGMTFACWA
jgi:3-O-methylgallate 3,4-dioxygenase